MDRVKQLYFSFSPSERKAIRSYLDAFHLKGENKAMEFLKLIEKSPDITQEQAADKLYGEMRSKAFIMMKGRLLDKMTEFLTLTVNPEASRRDHEAPYHHDLIEFRKAMLHATALQERQLSSLALEYLEKARDLAARCNAPELEVDALIRLRGLDRTGTERFEAISIQIQKALVQQECDINAMGLMRKFLALHSQKITSDEARAAFLQAHLPELEERLRQVYSPRADYFLQMLKVHDCFISRSYEPGKAAALQATEVLKKYEGMRSPIRLSDTWFQLGRLELRCAHFTEAIETFKKARAALPTDSKTHLYPTLLLGYCYLHLRDGDATHQVLEELRQGTLGRVVQANAFAKGLFSYINSCHAYSKGDYHQAWLHLQGCQDANLGKESWLTAIRLFEVMLLIDKDQGDLASQKLENLRKHLARYNTPLRMRAIYKLLAAQERTDFSFKAVAGEDVELQRLRDELPWDPMSQEIVRFEDWYLAHRARAVKR
jgi:tetratricopeptide (TPR) repeat protein